MKTREFANIWQALEDDPRVAASLRARANLMIAISAHIRRLRVTQAEAARLLHVSQPRVSDLMRGHIDRFSVDTLLDMAVAAGLTPHVSVTGRARHKPRSRPPRAAETGLRGVANR